MKLNTSHPYFPDPYEKQAFTHLFPLIPSNKSNSSFFHQMLAATDLFPTFAVLFKTTLKKQ